MPKFDNPLQKLRQLEQSSEEKPTPSKVKKGELFDNPLGDVTAQEIAKVTQEKSMAGQYKRKTISLPPEQVRYINQIAKKEGLGVLEVYRWLIDLAISHYEAGERPEEEAKVERITAKKSHWTSKS